MAGVKTQKGGAVNAAPPRVVLTRHTCATCATLIMSNEVSSVIEISFEGGFALAHLEGRDPAA